jgi:hypothetical protein
VGQRLVSAEYGIPEGPFRRPEIDRVFALLDGLGHALDQGEVQHVVVEVNAADGEFGPQGGCIEQQNQSQEQMRKAFFARENHGGSA